MSRVRFEKYPTKHIEFWKGHFHRMGKLATVQQQCSLYILVLCINNVMYLHTLMIGKWDLDYERLDKNGRLL